MYTMGYHLILCGDPITLCGDVYNPVLVMTFPEWLSGTETWLCTTRRRASVLVVLIVFLRAFVQFCRFDKAGATADVQWHYNHRPPLWYHYFPAQRTVGADTLVCWLRKIVRKCAADEARRSADGLIMWWCQHIVSWFISMVVQVVWL